MFLLIIPNMSDETQSSVVNPLDPIQALKPPANVPDVERAAHPQNTVLDEDSAVTKAEKLERHGDQHDFPEPEAKRIKVEHSIDEKANADGATRSERRKGVAPIKQESVFQRDYVSMKGSSLSGIWSTQQDPSVVEVEHPKTMMLPKEQPTNPRGKVQITGASEKKNPGVKTQAGILAPPKTRLAFVARG